MQARCLMVSSVSLSSFRPSGRRATQAHESLRDPTDNSVGNYGLRDQQEALRWLQRNVARFGGDRHRVLLFGQSSGGTSIFGLLASPASNGLFASAVVMSGSPNV